MFLFSIVPCQLIDQGALARARWAGESNDSRASAEGKQSLKQFRPAWRAIFDRTDGTGKSSRISGAKLINQVLDAWLQAD
jgi:hypothetical protein